MLIRKFSLDEFEAMGECRWKLLYPWQGVANTPFWSGWTHLRPGEKTKKHQHHEIETYFIAQGRGEMRIDDEVVEVGPGDVLYMPPFHHHVLANTSKEDVLFLSVFWEDMKALADLPADAAERTGEMALVAAAVPPGRGGDLPAAAGPLLAADVHARYLRMRGADVRVLSTPPSGGAPAVLSTLRIEAESPDFRSCASAVQELFATLHASGKLAVRRGQLYFPLGAYAEPLKRYHLAASMGPRIRSVAERTVALGLDDVLLTQPSASGIPVLLPGFEGQSFVPAVEALGACLAALRQGGEKWSGFFRGTDARAALFFDPEQCQAFAVLYPALLLARDPESRLPESLVAVETPPETGDALRTPIAGEPADLVRFHLARTWPEVGDGGRPVADLQASLAGELIGRWQDWLSGLAARLRNEYGGVVPSTGFYTAEQSRFYKRLLGYVHQAGQAYEAKSFSLQRAVRILSDLVWEARRFNLEEDFWIGVPDRGPERRSSIALGLAAAKILAMISAPLLPGFAARLASALGDEATSTRWVEVPDWVPAGSRVEALDRPFFKVTGRQVHEEACAAVAQSPP